MYVAVSGNLGSGKSTVASQLASIFNCTTYPRTSYDRSYIEDKFGDPDRWTAEAQISFLLHKYESIREGMKSGRFFILDRSLDEEVRVFASKFHDDGEIDSRSHNLITQIYDELNQSVEKPSLIVYCDCSTEVCRRRIEERSRPYQKYYKDGHLEKLHDKLEQWISIQKLTNTLRIRTDLVDFRSRDNAVWLAEKVNTILDQSRNVQIDLFAPFQNTADAAGKTRIESISTTNMSLYRRQTVYLAAPYTQKSRQVSKKYQNGGLFDGEVRFNTISRHYRNQLISISKIIEGYGYEVILPHRDINKWGGRIMTPGDVAINCLRAIDRADYIVAMIGESFGTHVEVGYALGLGKKVVILISDANPASFFGGGVAELKGVTTVRGKSIPELVKKLKSANPIR